MKCWPQPLTRSSEVGNSAFTVSTGTPALSAISGHVVAWMPWLMCSSSVDSMIRSRVGSTSRGSPGSSPDAASKPRRRASCQNSELGDRCRGGRLLERSLPARGQLPEHLAADLAPGDETALEQPAAGTAHLGLVDLEQAAQLRASQLRRAVEHAQEVVGLRSLGDRGRATARARVPSARRRWPRPATRPAPDRRRPVRGRRGGRPGQRPGSRRRVRAGRRPGRVRRPPGGPAPRRASRSAAPGRDAGSGLRWAWPCPYR